MATQLQIRRGTTAQMNAFTGAEGELAVNTTTDTVHVHDGSTAGGFALAKADGSNIGTYAGSFTTLAASGAVTLSSTLAVTGALTVDTNTLVVDATNNRVGIGTSSPASALHVDSGTANNVATFSSTDAYALIKFEDNDTTTETTLGALDNDMVFRVGAAERMRIDGSSGNVGIGTSSPEKPLHVNSGTGNIGVRVESSDATASIEFMDSGTTSTATSARVGGISNDFFVQTNGLERMRIDGASGNVGIGTSSPSSFNYLSTSPHLVIGGGSSDAGVTCYSSTNGYGRLAFADGTNTTEQYRGLIQYYHSDNSMQFYTNATEAFRITAARDMYFGTTSGSTADAGHIMQENGVMFHTADATTSMYLKRLNSDGDILEFRKDSTTVGSIGVASSNNMYFCSTAASHSGILFGTNIIYATDNTGAATDNITDLGSVSFRFDDIYATNGTIQTSDRNEKQDIEALSDAEQRVAVAAKGLMRKFRWISSVQENGDNARIHFGIIAQDLQAAFEAEGLDAGRYAMFISDTWWETQTEVAAVEETEDTEAVEAYTRTDTYDTAEEAPEGATERTRLGVRYNELLAFIISAI